ncbi:HemK family modification methylase [Psychromonas sp. CNPT3]|uniref:peptide chain release factor N(5)-glutamine methyltransferase n=1 Tax=Psychromonas sp. CNPT3 TaxID=314282 RepID=UPI00006E85B2|nr:peptide chain release factor N(5)-glutamine methyltransferase [Psychromonas sp. CNPT3]AGH81442.1 HemK family modification methylase [Psychromonas sp. CNPT3]
MRIDAAVVWAKSLLLKSDSALLDAQVLLCFVLQKESVYLMTWPERLLTDMQKEAYKALIDERIKGVPVAYLTGTREFWSLPFKVNASTLIPRADTETLVEYALQVCSPNSHILDLGTGTGAIILALASELPHAQCSAVDFNADAVQLAIENRQALKLDNVNIYQSDWFSQVHGRFDLIVSNPPYIDKEDHHLAEGDVRFEPLSALVADDKGLADIHLIVSQARLYLKTNGTLMIEHGFEQGEAVRNIFRLFEFDEIRTECDLARNERISIAIYKGSK